MSPFLAFDPVKSKVEVTPLLSVTVVLRDALLIRVGCTMYGVACKIGDGVVA
jgi:hypothetical protein